jgi:hypothetical protein
MDLARVRELPDEPLMKLVARRPERNGRNGGRSRESTKSPYRRAMVEYYPTLVRAVRVTRAR